MKLFLFFLMLITPLLYSKNQVVQPVLLKKLPLGVSTFKKFVEGGYLYVDKTKNIHSLIQSGRHYFLVRPRRFGRTLFLSTLQEIFSGNKKLFQDCWIGNCDQYDWPVYSVINLNFLMIDDSSPEIFDASLLRYIYFLAEQYEIIFSKDLSLEKALTAFFQILSERGKLVLLVDEYDKPLRKHQCNNQSVNQIRQTLKKLYEVIGSLDDHFRAIIITGVVPYAASTLFASIPQLKNISASPEAAQLCGFTDDEMRSVLFPYIEQYAETTKKVSSEIMDELSKWYGGYRFAQQEHCVYSPIPLFYHLDRMENGLYWLETSTPTFLVQWMKSFPNLFYSQKSWTIFQSYGDSCEPGALTASATLWYAGYLTLHSSDDYEKRHELTFPNQGTEEGFRCLLGQ